MFETMLNDNEKGKEQDCTGVYLDRFNTGASVNSQELFYQEAYDGAMESK